MDQTANVVNLGKRETKDLEGQKDVEDFLETLVMMDFLEIMVQIHFKVKKVNKDSRGTKELKVLEVKLEHQEIEARMALMVLTEL